MTNPLHVPRLELSIEKKRSNPTQPHSRHSIQDSLAALFRRKTQVESTSQTDKSASSPGFDILSSGIVINNLTAVSSDNIPRLSLLVEIYKEDTGREFPTQAGIRLMQRFIGDGGLVLEAPALANSANMSTLDSVAFAALVKVENLKRKEFQLVAMAHNWKRLHKHVGLKKEERALFLQYSVELVENALLHSVHAESMSTTNGKLYKR